jgi:hypothetical protein
VDGPSTVGVVAGVAALVVAVVGVYWARAAVVTGKSLVWEADVQSLLNQATDSSAVRVLYGDDRELAEPYVLRVTLSNRGRKDVRSEDFDQGRPLRFTLSHGAIVTSLTPLDVGTHNVDPSANTVSVGPDLIKAGTIQSLTVLTDGRPRVELNAHLADTEVVDVGEIRSSRRNRQLWIAFGVCCASLGISVLLGVETIRLFGVGDATAAATGLFTIMWACFSVVVTRGTLSLRRGN